MEPLPARDRASFENKVALVTGAATGIGMSGPKAFAEAGATVTLADVNADAARAAADQPVEAGHRAIAVHCDGGDEKEVAVVIERTVSAFGRLDAADTMPACRVPRSRPRQHIGGIRACDRNQSTRSVGLYEIPGYSDAQAGQWCHRKLLIDWWTDWSPGSRRLPLCSLINTC